MVRTEPVAINSDAHQWDEGVLTDIPTCSNKGAKLYTCELCEATKLVDVDKDSSSHNPAEAVEENRFEASCTVDGSYDSVVYCQDCGV